MTNNGSGDFIPCGGCVLQIFFTDICFSFARLDDYLYIYVMFVRRKVNKSGSVSIQVLDKRNGRNVLLRSFGASKKESVIREMERQAHDFINTYGGQLVLDFDEQL